ncbi:zinc finger and SCAN domain-containing protein 5A-like isoform X1 [Watersipora subatra]|uniref:zinc finger and SCAN domain-containing protein 5A-like isoform X1 n=1 Tax=Watersipora subatra TaxID=2589382 RepID=UPI00355BCDBC
MSARMPTKMQPRRNPLLTMARYMSDAGADGYTGLTLLYHQTTTQLIIQWTGTDISQSEKLAAEQNLLKLLKGCDVIDSSEDIEPLEFEEGDQEPEMTEDATEMEAINFTEPTSPEFDVKKEPAEITLSSCGKSHTSGGVTVTSYSMAPLGLPTVLAETSSGSGQLSSQEPTTSCGNSLASISQSPGQNLHAGQFTPLSAKERSDNMQGREEQPEEHLPPGPDSGSPGTSQVSVKPFQCTTCDFSTNFNWELSKHASSCPASETQRTFRCSLCFTNFSDRNMFIRHVSSHRFNPAVNPSTATSRAIHKTPRRVPFKGFTSNFARAAATASSSDGRPRCTVCFTEFTSRSALTRHMRRHMGIMPFSCSFCDRKFSRKDSATEHQKSHLLKIQKEQIRSMKALSEDGGQGSSEQKQMPTADIDSPSESIGWELKQDRSLNLQTDIELADSREKQQLQSREPSLGFPVFPS